MALRNLILNTRGNVAPTVALSLVGLVAAGGIAFDYARMAALDTELQAAADQAALAAASQLDGEDKACERAVAAARQLLQNRTVMSNDGQGLDIDVPNSGVCTSDTQITDNTNASIRFFVDKLATDPAETNDEANFVEVTVENRQAKFALTPIVHAMASGNLSAKARAGMGTALCKVPPLMVCPPSTGLDWNTLRGHGVRAVSNSGPNWSPGNFGYIGPQDANSTQIGLAFQNPVFQCQEIESEQSVSSGGPTPAITAINTRFDIYSMSSGSGVALAPCLGSACPPARNVTKDLVRQTGGGKCDLRNNHSNGLGNEGWHLVENAANRFVPRVKNVADTAMTQIDANGVITAMGLPRDNLHYCSYNVGGVCNTSRFGDGVWARGDYWATNHPGVTPPSGSEAWTRYETYLWELSPLGTVPSQAAGVDRQEGAPICNMTVADPTRDRRVLTVAVGSNCGALHGASTPVQIEKWVEMFLVEPGVPNPGRGNGDSGNEIYLEVIREVDPGGAAAQIIRRDTPYLVK